MTIKSRAGIGMKKHVSKTLLILFAILLSSCGSTVQETGIARDAQAFTETDMQTEAIPETESETAVDIAARFADVDFDGASFRICTLERNKFEIASDELTGEICNDAIYNRNLAVNDALNVHIEALALTTRHDTDQLDTVQKSVVSGEDFCDMATGIAYLTGGYLTKGIFRNWRSLPVIDFDAPWWVTRANDAFTIGGKQFAAVGDLGITLLLQTYGTFFNKTLAEEYGIDGLYDTVLDGKWTIDLLDTLAATVYTDVNGDGTRDMGDIYGYVAERVINCDVMLPSFDQPLLSRDSDGLPYVTINTERTHTAVEKIYKLFYENPGSYIVDQWADELPIFAVGRSLFITTYLGNAFDSFRDMEDPYGILPFPKYDEAQADYLCDARDQYSVFVVPATTNRTELVGYTMEALNIESRNTVYPAYYETALQSKYVHDAPSVEMLDILLAGRNYSFAILHSSNLSRLPYLVRQLMEERGTDFASLYAKKEEEIEKGLRSVIDAYLTYDE